MKRPIVLCVIDGLGLRAETEGNAWKKANTPNFDDLLANYPNSVLKAAGESVGLPVGQMGNSEVGHLNIGAGQIVYTGLSLIRKSIEDGTFSNNHAFTKSIEHAKKSGGRVHVIGLLSPGGVHSLDEHLYEILDSLNSKGVNDVVVHPFADGRDVAPKAIIPELEKLTKKVNELNYSIGSIAGRLYSMDRDENFAEKTEVGFEAIKGNAKNKFDNVIDYINNQYEKGLNDEFIEPAVWSELGDKGLKDGDSVIFFNFRPDRARQLAHVIVGSDIYDFKPKNPVSNVQLTSMMNYEGIKNADIAFDSMEVKSPIGKVLSDRGITQLRIAETQKYAHVTFFMDGGVDVVYPHSKRILVDSPKVDNFADAPKMAAEGITDELIKVLGEEEFVIMNYANPDMVGHTGNEEAAILAMEFLDLQIGKLKKAIDKIGGTLFITADHGNVEIMKDENGRPAKKHTSSDVPFICTDKSINIKDGILANVAPTVLDYAGIEKGNSMDQKSLLIKK